MPDGAAPASSLAAPAKPKYTGEPISVNLKDVDLKDFFRLIHEISGLNIVLDPSVKGTVTLVLDDVPWDQALDIVLKNNSLDRELQGNVLRIAATDTLRREAVDRRAQAEAVALAVDRQTITRSLSYAKAKDVVPTIKKFLTARGDVISDERTNCPHHLGYSERASQSGSPDLAAGQKDPGGGDRGARCLGNPVLQPGPWIPAGL